MKSYYETYWEPEDWIGSRFSGRLRNILEKHVRGAAVLDAGCGDGGTYGTWLASVARSYAGVDISARAVERARARGLAAQEIDELAALPFPDASFDAVVCVEVLEHLLFPMEAVRELGRVLRPDGVFIATVPNMAYWRRRLDIAVFGQFHPLGTAEGARRPWQDPHLRFFTRRSFRRLFVEAGFACRVVGVNGSLFGDLPFLGRRFGSAQLSRPFDWLEILWPALFGSNLCAIAVKPAVADR